MIRLALVEDQRLVRDGIRNLLGLVDDIDVVGEAADGAEAIALIADISPDVVLLDLRMPKMGGLEVLETLGRRGNLPPTIILTTFDDGEALLRAIKAGARGFLLKDVSLDQLAAAIRVVAAGGTMIQPGVTEQLMRNFHGSNPAGSDLDGTASLSARERQVIRLMVGGYRNKEIADAFGVTTGTIKNHVSNILSKLDVRDRTRAVLKAIEIGIV